MHVHSCGTSRLNRAPTRNMHRRVSQSCCCSSICRQMPYSAKHKLVFIHVPKTGGTSVEVMLGMRNTRSLWKHYSNTDTECDTVPQHWPASRLRIALGEHVWKDSTKFAIVRNPLERFVSAYKWGKRRGHSLLSLAQFVESELHPDAANRYRNVTRRYAMLKHKLYVAHLLPQCHLIDEPDIVVLRLENIITDWERFVHRYAPQVPGVLIRSQTSDGQSLSKQDEADMPLVEAIVRRVYKADYERFYPHLLCQRADACTTTDLDGSDTAAGSGASAGPSA